MKYYLFLRKEKELLEYKAEFERVRKSIDEGKTPVQNEMRVAKTILCESFPYQALTGVFLVIGTLILDKCRINDLAKIAVVLIVNNMCYAVSNYIFTVIKHGLRLRLCRRLGVEPTERNIAVMESLEYQSV